MKTFIEFFGSFVAWFVLTVVCNYGWWTEYGVNIKGIILHLLLVSLWVLYIEYISDMKAKKEE